MYATAVMSCPQEEIAGPNKEVLACVSNSALISPDGRSGMLKMWIDGAQRAGVKNIMVIAIDDAVRCNAVAYGVKVSIAVAAFRP
jgi:hypothetical protein